MRVIQPMQRGFFGRSLDEFKRLSKIALTAEAIATAKPRLLWAFHDVESTKQCKIMSDRDIGGFSTSNLDYIPPSTSTSSSSSTTTTPSSTASPQSSSLSSSTLPTPKGYARFHGKISIDLPTNRPDVQRTGFAAFRTLQQAPTIFGQTVWDIDPFAYLALRVKSDGRKYFVNLQTESIVHTDIHQHRLYARRPGEWETVLIKWDDFVRTNHGMVVEPQGEMLRQKLRTVGVGSIDRVPGSFELCIERIWATNRLTEDEVREDERTEEGQLTSKHGQKIRWNEDG